jgi:hypothetical protein
MPVVQGRELPTDEQVLDVRGQFERIAVRHDDIDEFALLEGPVLLVQPENMLGIKLRLFLFEQPAERVYSSVGVQLLGRRDPGGSAAGAAKL